VKKTSVLILYSLPAPFFSNGTPDTIGQESVLSRLQAVQQALCSLGYPVQTLEAKGEISLLLKRIRSAKADVVFNLCEEFLGRTRLEMNLAALLELLDIPFTGSSALVLGLSQDKGKTKSILAQHGIPTPAYRVWQPGLDGLLKGLQFPLIIKPLREDASLGIDNDAFIRDEKALKQRVHKIFHGYRQPALVEEYIEGRELNISILGNKDPRVLPISEIDFSSMPPGWPKICGYAAKWVEGSQEFSFTVPRCPAPLSQKIEKKLKEVSLLSYRVMECRDYARVDIRLSPQGIPYVLEINANPDISPDAGMTRSAQMAGFTYPEFISYIVELGRARITPSPSHRRHARVPPGRKSRV
jgi:D-alanine-D-alanine ligase